MTILLIYPPFAMPDKPYISLPVLAAHLESLDIPVSCWDANLAFFRKTMAPSALEQRGWKEEKPPRDLFNEENLGNRERLVLFGRYLELINSSTETLRLTGNTGYLRYDPGISLFDSHALVTAAGQSGSLTRNALKSRIPDLLEKTGPFLAGISVAFPDQILPALTLAAILKEARPDLPVILGGAFVTIHMQQTARPELFNLVDALVLGDGEEVLTTLYDQAKTTGNLRGIPDRAGVIFRDSQGRIHASEPVIYPMEKSRPPAYRHLPLNDYLMPRDKGAVLFRLSRGCYWARCAFCNSLSPIINAYDCQTFEETYKALIRTLEETGAPIIHFTDDAASPEMLAFLADRLISENRQIHWTVNARVDKRLTLSLLTRLRRAGCFSLFLGVESCSNRVLKKMNKGTSLKRTEQLLTDLSWAGISANVYMITGFPTETQEEALASFKQVSQWLEKGLVRQVVYNLFSLTPCSPVAADPAAFGITECPHPRGKDLSPPLSDFTCATGMTRQEAEKMYAMISQTLTRLNTSAHKTSKKRT